jgi:hypothetical protein
MLALLASLICLFQPPPSWEIAHLKKPTPEVLVGFLAKESSSLSFRPSINLAIEEIDGTLKEYVKAVKEIHLAEPKTQWRDLGKFTTKAGEGRLTEISKPSPFGEMKIFQTMVVKENKAYILTAAVLKEDLSKLRPAILESFKSLDLVPDLWAPIADSSSKKEMQDLFASLNQTGDLKTQKRKLQQHIEAHADLGPYWQFLALKEGFSKLNTP